MKVCSGQFIDDSILEVAKKFNIKFEEGELEKHMTQFGLDPMMETRGLRGGDRKGGGKRPLHKCDSCNFELSVNDNFCPNCGVNLSDNKTRLDDIHLDRYSYK